MDASVEVGMVPEPGREEVLAVALEVVVISALGVRECWHASTPIMTASLTMQKERRCKSSFNSVARRGCKEWAGRALPLVGVPAAALEVSAARKADLARDSVGRTAARKIRRTGTIIRSTAAFPGGTVGGVHHVDSKLS